MTTSARCAFRIRRRFQNTNYICSCPVRQGGKINFSARGGEVVLAGGGYVVNVAAGNVRGEALEPAAGIDEAHVLADLRVADIPPQPNAGGVELAHQFFGFQLGGQGFPCRQVFQTQMDAGFLYDGGEFFEAVYEGFDLARRFSIAGDLRFQLEVFIFLAEVLAAFGHAQQVKGKLGHIHVAGVADNDFGADFGGKAQSAGDVRDGEFAFAAVEGAGGVKFGVGAGRANGHGAEVVYAADLHRAGGNHGFDAGDQLKAQVVAQFHLLQAQREDFLQHGFAGQMPPGVPACAEAKWNHDFTWA